MAIRKPLVIGAGGLPAEMPATDTLPVANSGVAATAAQLNAAFLDVSNASAYSPPAGAGFSTYPLSYVTSDAGGNYSTSTFYYTVRFTGLYEMVTKLRPNDSSSNMSFGHCPDTALRDSANFVWGLSVGNRLVSVNVRFARLTAGDLVRLCFYADGANPSFGSASMIISLISVG